MTFRYLTLLSLWLLVSCGQNVPDSPVTIPRIFSDGMVLQRDQTIQVWGKGIPGEKIRASVAGAVGSSNVLEDSTWKVQLPPLPAGGPYQLEVNSQKFEDVYIGDVWLAGGQSNMEWTLKSSVIGAEDEFAAADFPLIRFFKVAHDYSAEEQFDLKSGEWKVANAENLPDFSAVAWFFAKKNHLEKGVPVGIIESNWGGTPAEGWTETAVLAKIDERSYTKESQEVLENKDKWIEILAENEKNRILRDSLVLRPDPSKALEVSGKEFPAEGWQGINLPAANPLSHIAWVRKTFNLSTTEGAVLHLPGVEQMAFFYLNGTLLHHKDWGVPVPELELPANILNSGKNVLTIRAINTWNNQPSIGQKDEMYILQNGKKLSLEGSWAYSNSIVEPQLPKVEYYNWKPGFMFNSMIAPLIPYSIKGVIWYQGESNAGRADEYRELFSAMISNWRERWGQGDFPFLFVQLANFMERKELQPDSEWAYLREAQTETLSLPKTGMAVILDIGEADDIHPRNKKDVGERLWLQAKKVAFGEKVLASGPVFLEATLNGNQLLMKFSEVGSGIKTLDGEAVKAVILEDGKGKFVTVEGRIEGADQVVIEIPQGFVPVGVRYAWADNPEINLVNELGLPAGPFKAVLE